MLFRINLLPLKYFLNVKHFSSTIVGLPFKIKESEALKILENNHSIFETDIREKDKKFSKRKIIKAYIPFHTVIIKNLASKYVGEKGHDRTEVYWVTVTNSKGNSYPQMQTRTVTDWYPVSGKTYQSDYNVNLERTKLHRYADFEFPEKYIANCLVTNNVIKSSYENINVDSSIKIYPHNMNFSKAFDDILKVLTTDEKTKAEEHIINAYNCDRSSVNQTTMLLENIDLETLSYHIPAYLYITEIDGRKICKIINGYNGQYNGDSVYSTLKMGIGGTAFGILIGFVSIPFFPVYVTYAAQMTVARLIAIRIGLSGLVGGLFGSIGSVFYTSYHYESTRDKLKTDKIENDSTEETLEDVERKQIGSNSYQSHADSKKNADTQTKSKTKTTHKYEYEYGILQISLETKLTLVSLKKSRIEMLKKYHPDVYKGNKDTANLMTISINEAYETLLKTLEQ